MSDVLYDNILVVSYFVLWVVTFFMYHFKNRRYDAGSLIITMYVVYAAASIFSINDPLFSMVYEPFTIFPFIYLYVMMMLALLPAIYFHNNPSEDIREPNTKIFVIIGVILVVSSILSIPSIFADGTDGIVSIATDTDAGKEAYSEQVDGIADSGSKIRNLPAVIYNALSDLIPFLCFYFMTKKNKNYVLIAALLFALLVGIGMQISKGQRGGLVATILTAMGGYLLFKPYLSKFFTRMVSIIGYSLVILIAIPISTITMGRFGDKELSVTGFITWYVGQGNLYFNNYGLDAGGIRYGDRTMNLFKRIIDPSVPANYVERREKYHNLEIDDYYYTTFVGDFTLDFGPYIALLIFVVFNFYILHILKRRDGSYSIQQILMLYFSICICLQGGMSLFSYSDTGNLRIVVFIMLYAYLCLHEIFLKKFPAVNVLPDEK